LLRLALAEVSEYLPAIIAIIFRVCPGFSNAQFIDRKVDRFDIGELRVNFWADGAVDGAVALSIVVSAQFWGKNFMPLWPRIRHTIQASALSGFIAKIETYLHNVSQLRYLASRDHFAPILSWT